MMRGNELATPVVQLSVSPVDRDGGAMTLAVSLTEASGQTRDERISADPESFPRASPSPVSVSPSIGEQLGRVLVPSSMAARLAEIRRTSAAGVVRLVLAADPSLAGWPWEAALVDLQDGAGLRPLWSAGINLVRVLPSTAGSGALRRLPIGGARVMVAGATDAALEPYADLLWGIDGSVGARAEPAHDADRVVARDHVTDPFTDLGAAAAPLALRTGRGAGARADVFVLLAHGARDGSVLLADGVTLPPATLATVARRVGARVVAVLACEVGAPPDTTLDGDHGVLASAPTLVAELFRHQIAVAIVSQTVQDPVAGAAFIRELHADLDSGGLDQRLIEARTIVDTASFGGDGLGLPPAAVPAVWVADPSAGLGMPRRQRGPVLAERRWLTDRVGEWVTQRQEVVGSSVRVVSGAPGAGKSSLLRALVEADGAATAGLPVALEVMRDRNAEGWLDQPDTTADVITSWEHRCGIEPSDRPVADRFARLRDELAGDRALVVVIDEWDQLPTDVTAGLQALIEAPHDGAVLWVVGSRHDRPRFAGDVDVVEIDITATKNRRQVDDDLGRYATERLSGRRDGDDLAGWLVNHADGLFIYVAKLCQRLTDPKVLDDPTDSLHPDHGVDQITAALPETIEEVWVDEIHQARQRADHALGAAGAADLTRILALVLATVDGTPLDVIDDLVGYPTRDAVWRWVRPLCTLTDNDTAAAVHPTLVDAFHTKYAGDTRHAFTQLADWCDTHTDSGYSWAITHRLPLRTRALATAPGFDTAGQRRRLAAAAGDLAFLDALCATAGITAVEAALRAAADLAGDQPLESLGATIAALHRVVAAQAAAIGDLGDRPGDLTQQVHLHAALHLGIDHPLTAATAQLLEASIDRHDAGNDPIPRLVVDAATGTISEPPITLPRRYGVVTAITTLDHPTEGPLLATAHDTGLICTWNATNPYEPLAAFDTGSGDQWMSLATVRDQLVVISGGLIALVNPLGADAPERTFQAACNALGRPIVAVVGTRLSFHDRTGSTVIVDPDDTDRAPRLLHSSAPTTVASMAATARFVVLCHLDGALTIIDADQTDGPVARPAFDAVRDMIPFEEHLLLRHWNGTITIYDPSGGQRPRQRTLNIGPVWSATTVAGGRLVLGHNDGLLRFIDSAWIHRSAAVAG